MLTLKLARKGKKNQPLFRLIIQEKTKSPKSSFLEDLGSYNPRTKKAVLYDERIKHWLSHGAQATPTVHNLLINQGIIKGEKRSATKGHPQKAAEPKTEVAPATPAV